MSDKMDWGAMMRLGLRQLGLRPDQFWALTPIELFVMAGLDTAQKPFSRDRFDALLDAYPDQQTEPNGGA